jgi:glycoside/pentoside/hexuronide:cation symporter, GPH family
VGNIVTQSKRLPLFTSVAYGFGSLAFGVKNNGFDYYLLIFYSQVVGMDARLVGLALLIALVIDAISDPIVGYWSDNLRSRWGRRHPFMFAAAFPVTISYFLIWAPPENVSAATSFWFLLIMAIVIRTSITFFETPNAALAPELTTDYEERSQLISFRYFFAWSGGNLMNILMFFWVFPVFASNSLADGSILRRPYEIYGIIASLLILLSILVSAAATYSRIPYLKAPPKRKLSVGQVFKEMFETVSNRSFVALFLAAILGAVATGLGAALHIYFVAYFWEFEAHDIGLLSIGIFASAFLGFRLAPWVTRKMGKKKGAMTMGLVAFIGAPLPVVLRLIDVLPANGDPFIFWFILVTGITDLGLMICFQILVASMLADIVEQSELATGRRSEGVFTASITFARKSVQGLGIMAASIVLTIAAFPVGVSIDQVPEQSIWMLGATYVPLVLTLWLLMMAALSTYTVSRTVHETNLRELAKRAMQGSEGEKA